MKNQAKRMLVASLFSTVACFGQSPALEPVTQPFTINVHASKPEFAVGSPVELKFVLTNTSDHDMKGSTFHAYGLGTLGYLFDIRDSDGQPVRARAQDGPKRALRGSAIMWMLKPKESREEQTTISAKDFDLSQPGQYAIRLCRLVGDDFDGAEICSNAVAVRIIALGEVQQLRR